MDWLTLGVEDNVTLQYVEKHSPNDTESHPRRLELLVFD
jgi:hypothetical protein